MNKIIDLSQPIEDTMPVYPKDLKTNLAQIKYLNRDKYNNHRLEISMHSGTHIDSQMHLTDFKHYISELPLEPFIAEGCVLDVRDQLKIGYKDEYDTLIKENSIVLFYTGYDVYYGFKEYYENHPHIDIELCKLLIAKNIKMVGMDTPSQEKT